VGVNTNTHTLKKDNFINPKKEEEEV